MTEVSFSRIGRFNLTQGMLNTAIEVGAGLSNLLAGFVVKSSAYNVGFLILAALAVVALRVFWFFVPATKPAVPKNASKDKRDRY